MCKKIIIKYNENIPTPEAYFNQQMGEWHLSHDQILSYLKMIAGKSGRVRVEEYARSYENRPLVHLIITSENNQQNLKELKELHRKHAAPSENISPDEVPLIVSLGYSVHGNESSAGNSSVLSACYLASATGEKIDRLLESTIVLIDPCMNPDGFTRHST